MEATASGLMARAAPRPAPPSQDFDRLEQGVLKQSRDGWAYYRIVIDAARAGRRDIVDRAVQAAERYPANRGGNVQYVLVERLAGAAVILGDHGLFDRVLAQYERLFAGRERSHASTKLGKAAAALAARQGGAPVVARFVDRYKRELAEAKLTNGGEEAVWANFAQWSAYHGMYSGAETGLARVGDPRYRLLIAAQLLESAIRAKDGVRTDKYVAMLSREYKGGPTRTRKHF